MASSTIRMPNVIAKKRDGQSLTSEEIAFFVTGVVNGSIPREQIGAMLMAIYLKGMDTRETVDLTRGLMFSGQTLSWPDFPGLVVDKHSTGGVGDKVSLPLAAALAACGAKVPMISGRGLGHTGGTLDKLEAIPGFSVHKSAEEMTQLLRDVGCCIVGQTETLVPADRILYAIRDITSTVESLPLITASIVSKKAAEGLSALVLDVKVGRAAFMKTRADGQALARSMVDAGNGAGVKTLAILTEMDRPIGRMVGNALEVIESVHCLQGKGPADLEELVVVEGGHLLALNGLAPSADEGVARIRATLHDGSALARFQQMVAAQGAGPAVAAALCADPVAALPRAAFVTDIPALAAGFVVDIDAMALARVSGELGAGRVTTDSKIDYTVGIEIVAHLGDAASPATPLCRIHHTLPLSQDHLRRAQAAFAVAADRVAPASRIIEFLH